jgi:hypothetical protein
MRVVIGLHADQEPEALAETLRSHGARHVQGPAPSLPDVLVADFPEGDMDGTVKTVAKLPGVRYAEPDEWQSIAT